MNILKKLLFSISLLTLIVLAFMLYKSIYTLPETLSWQAIWPLIWKGAGILIGCGIMFSSICSKPKQKKQTNDEQ
jgi:hypothetical protein